MKAMNDHGETERDLVDTHVTDKLEARYANLIPALVKAIQELSLEVEALKEAA